MRDNHPEQELPRFSWREVCARRLDRQSLARPATDSCPAAIVSAMCGAHAQILTAAELSIGVRLAGITRVEVRAALWDERRLVKTFGPRGTVHLLPTRELPMWTAALAAVPSAGAGSASSVLLSPEQTDEVVAAIAAALAATELTIDDLNEAVIAGAGPWAGDLVMPAFDGMWPRWRQAVATAAHRGALCFGPNRGRKVTYTSPRRWLPDFVPMAEREALAGVVRHYLHAYGPATPRQFAQWLAAPRRWAGELFDSLAGEIEQVVVDDQAAWVVAGDTLVTAEPPRGVRLLPYFDAYVVGSHPRAKVFPGRAAARALAGGQAGPFPILLIDGAVAGVWHLRRSGRRLEITVEPLDPLTPSQRGDLDLQVARIGEFVEAKPALTIGPVSVGAHA